MGRKASGCVLDQPTKQSVWLGGKWINLAAIHRTQGIHYEYLSGIISGRRTCSVATYLKIATAIDLTIDELLLAIEERKIMREKHELTTIANYQDRIKQENRLNSDRIRKGKAPIPSLPSFRLPEDRN